MSDAAPQTTRPGRSRPPRRPTPASSSRAGRKEEPPERPGRRDCADRPRSISAIASAAGALDHVLGEVGPRVGPAVGPWQRPRVLQRVRRRPRSPSQTRFSLKSSWVYVQPSLMSDLISSRRLDVVRRPPAVLEGSSRSRSCEKETLNPGPGPRTTRVTSAPMFTPNSLREARLRVRYSEVCKWATFGRSAHDRGQRLFRRAAHRQPGRSAPAIFLSDVGRLKATHAPSACSTTRDASNSNPSAWPGDVWSRPRLSGAPTCVRTHERRGSLAQGRDLPSADDAVSPEGQPLHRFAQARSVISGAIDLVVQQVVGLALARGCP